MPDDRTPWYMTTSGVLCMLGIQLLFWFICCAFFVWITLPDGGGIVVGHLVGCICAVLGFPSRFILGGPRP
jgi:hypothetical protein